MLNLLIFLTILYILVKIKKEHDDSFIKLLILISIIIYIYIELTNYEYFSIGAPPIVNSPFSILSNLAQKSRGTISIPTREASGTRGTISSPTYKTYHNLKELKEKKDHQYSNQRGFRYKGDDQ